MEIKFFVILNRIFFIVLNFLIDFSKWFQIDAIRTHSHHINKLFYDNHTNIWWYATQIHAEKWPNSANSESSQKKKPTFINETKAYWYHHYDDDYFIYMFMYVLQIVHHLTSSAECTHIFTTCNHILCTSNSSVHADFLQTDFFFLVSYACACITYRIKLHSVRCSFNTLRFFFSFRLSDSSFHFPSQCVFLIELNFHKLPSILLHVIVSVNRMKVQTINLLSDTPFCYA